MIKTRRISPETAHGIDQALRRRIAAVTKGSSPVDVSLATLDLASHLAMSPGKLLSLTESAVRRSLGVGRMQLDLLLGREVPPLGDRRFGHDGWKRWPFAVLAQSHASAKSWVEEATTGVEGVTPEHAALCRFYALQLLEALSPANYPLTNPEVLGTTVKERGRNLARGTKNRAMDIWKKARGKPPTELADFRPGEAVAVTPGKVVFQNGLFELIQYAPTTETVSAEPVLIVPAWIMKYYILDLSPRNSLVKFLVDQGKTVFAISWKNPGAEDRDLGMDDYLHRGVLEALAQVRAIVPDTPVHGVGYCLGGTLMAIAAAYLAREGREELASLSMFAAQIDFEDAGEVRLFIAESTLSFLESLMEHQGYLDIENMVGAFSALRVSDLVYEPAMQRYWLGQPHRFNDLMAWNADGTRMPYRMHSQYLRRCYLDNDLAENRFEVDGRPIAPSDIRVPAFVLGTSSDHVAPWVSVYKAQRLLDTDVTFALTNGGHNAGVACGADHPRRKHQVASRPRGAPYRDPERWRAETATQAGSWWRTWDRWLDEHGRGDPVAPPPLGVPGRAPLRDAPGEYVFG